MTHSKFKVKITPYLNRRENMVDTGIYFKCPNCESFKTELNETIEDNPIPIEERSDLGTIYPLKLHLKCKDCDNSFSNIFYTARNENFRKTINSFINNSKDPFNNITIGLKVDYHSL
jgi:hypothetical protein